jgi:Flp pilus assembly protein TadG
MMIMRKIREFWNTRRSAIAVTAAIALVPLVLLVGIAVDVTFLSQDRLQTTFASHAASIAGVRQAASTYAIEEADNIVNGKAEDPTLAAKQAIHSADVTGSLWFDADLGTYSIGSNQSRTTVAKFDGNTDGSVNSAAPPNFSAQVTANSTYPPIFNGLFGRTSNWQYSESGTATSQFAYAQILLMLDTSSSMLIGADSPTDTLPMEQGVVCPANGTLASFNTFPQIIFGTTYLSTVYGGYTEPALSPVQPQGQNYLFNTPDGDNAYLGKNDPQHPASMNYPGTSDTDVSEKCSGSYTGFYVPGLGNSEPATPCGLACHYSNTISPATGYSEDYYGLARKEGVTLRLDVLFSATEQVIQDMESSEAVANQLSVGVYQFNTDVFPIVNASTGGAGALPEATSNLGEALQLVDQVDWKQTPGETVIPQLISCNGCSITPNASTASTGGDTNFPMSLSDLEAGNAVPAGAGGQKQPLTVTGQGNAEATPQKFMFIVTDGMEDDSPNNGSSSAQNVMGEMTSVIGEKNGTGSCSYLKNTLKYTVYVLYVDYNPVTDISYYGLQGPRPPNSYTTADNPGFTQANTSTQDLTAAETANGPTYSTAPVALALKACASATNDFYEANSSSEIQTALNSMLKSALASTIRLTN